MRRVPLRHALARTAAAALLGAIPTVVHAADVHASFGADSGGARARAVLADLRVPEPAFAGDRFDLGALRVEANASAALGWRRTAIAGPLGNLLIEGAVGVGVASGERVRAGVEVGVRGVAGPVALGVRAAYGNRVPFAWPELTVDVPASMADPRRRTGAGAADAVAAASASATWRVDRSWTVAVAPALAHTPTGWTGSLDASLRRYGVADGLDASVRIDAATGQRSRHAALGATLHHAPRRAPESRATVWAGAGSAGLALGTEVAWNVRSGASEVGLAAGWVPFRSDRPAGYAALQASAPMVDGRGRVALAWTGTTWLAELGWTRALRR